MSPAAGPASQTREASSTAPHEHVWHVIYVDFEDGALSTELTCACGEISFQ